MTPLSGGFSYPDSQKLFDIIYFSYEMYIYKNSYWRWVVWTTQNEGIRVWWAMINA